MSVAHAIPYVTEKEYLTLPESARRQELLDGELVLQRAPSLNLPALFRVLG